MLDYLVIHDNVMSTNKNLWEMKRLLGRKLTWMHLEKKTWFEELVFVLFTILSPYLYINEI